ncbi:MAG TPA: ATP synthase F1 subunit gamma [Fibrobacteria bacterium]|nr:ATP synthase F1 subunit gamma [Fibrobacteria bacterium]HOX53357.1 ATP synthase F1 subunit gamma [Fibrobacteria bacterium]
MPTIKELTNKLKNLQNTKKITAAMKMVAASKLRRAQEAIERTRPYRHELTTLLADLQSAVAGQELPDEASLWLTPRPVKHVSIVLFTSDKGLCGAFNNGLIRTFERVVGIRPMDAVTASRTGFTELSERLANTPFTVHFAGRRGWDAFRSKLHGRDAVGDWYQDAVARPSLAHARPIADRLIKDFLEGRTDEVWVVNNRFQSALTQTPQAIRIFPTVQNASKSSNKPILFDPPPAIVLSKLIPQSIRFLVLNALLENAAGEQGARMTAMDNATRNGQEMIDKYTLQKNRARQAQITTELVEIIAGAESIR